MTRQAIFEHISAFMVESLELKASIITLEARFVEDLDLDSIDAIDLAMALRELTGKKIQEEDLRSLSKISDVVDLVEHLQAQD